MLTITKRLRKHAVSRWKMGDDATDAEIRKKIGALLLGKRLSLAEINGINAGTYTPPPKKKGRDDDDDPPAPKKKGKAAAKSHPGTDDDRDDRDDDADPPRKKRKKPAGDATGVARTVRGIVGKLLARHGIGRAKAGDVNPAVAFTKATRIRVKEAAEGYSTARKGATYPMFRGVGNKQAPHPLAGMPARFDGVNLDHPSDRDKAVALAFLRFQVARSPMARSTELPRWLRQTDHDREILMYAAHNEKWVGRLEDRTGGTSVIKRSRLGPNQIKTLLDDSTSGGIEITPVVFDDALILTPVLYGELFPFVRVEQIARGRRVKGGSAINPTFTSGIGEGTAITPFNTASFVSAFDTPIYPAVAAIELGQDFEEDSPVDLGGQIVEQFGLKALEWLDRVIAVGNGTTEPLGIFNTTGTTLVNSVFGAGGPLTVSDAEGLMFGVPKQFRAEPGAVLAYVSNDYTYRKVRSIPVGAGDERRVFGMNHAAYEVLDTQYKVQNDIPDGYLAYANLRRFRMYRRLGMQVRVETGGRQLALNNTRLIVIRMRYGGQLELGGAAALMKDAQVV